MAGTSGGDEAQELLEKLKAQKAAWDAEGGDEEDETDALLQKAIDIAIEQGKGWSPGEKEEYMRLITDDDYLPPLFTSTNEELERSGMQEAFTSLKQDDETQNAAQLLQASKKKGNEAFHNGKTNRAGNVQFYRDAINHYYQAYAWAQQAKAITMEDKAADPDNNELYLEHELEEMRSTLCANAAMAHMQLKNWGHVRDQSKMALEHNDKNVKAWYRLAKALQMLQQWEAAGDAIDSGLAVDPNNKDLNKLKTLLADRVRKARLARQQRERARAQRVKRVKDVWKWCSSSGIQLGRIPLVATVTEDEEEGEHGEEYRWHNHHPHTGKLPQQLSVGKWAWPVMFLYPSHNQSDFVAEMAESDMLAMHMAQIFPELEADGAETTMPWDFNNEFTCSNLAVYFEVHEKPGKDGIIHPESVEPLTNQGDAMRFYEASRALKGDEGTDMANVARIMERKHLHQQRKAWKKKHKSLWAKPDPSPIVRVHPAMTLSQILTDERMMIPNFLVTFIMFPMEHPAHEAYLKEHKCLGIVEPSGLS